MEGFMKRRLLALLMVVAILMGMSITAHAEENEVRNFNVRGGKSHIFGGLPQDNTLLNHGDWITGGNVQLGPDYVKMSYNVSNLTINYEFKFKYFLADTYYYDLVKIWSDDAVYEDCSGSLMYYYMNGEIVGFSGTGTARITGRSEGIYYEIRVDTVEEKPEIPTEPELHYISTPFTGVADSDDGKYTLAIAGQFVSELEDGIHVLSAADITAQTMAIVAYNNTNGVKRVMRENTVEGMSVTVSGGEVTEYVIRGRVQTDGGTLDYYTATINP